MTTSVGDRLLRLGGTSCDREKIAPLDAFDKMAPLGWLGVAIPEEYGGSGLAMKRLLRNCTLLFLALLAGTFPAWAQNYQIKPIRMVLGAGAGGATDVIARAIAQKLSERLGQPVVVDNRPGANAVIGADAAAKAVPDGYSIILGSVSTHGSNPSFYARLPYDPVRDVAPISMVGQAPYIILVQPSFPANSVKEFIAQVQAKPGPINYGAGTNAARVGTEMFTSCARADELRPALTTLQGTAANPVPSATS